MIIVSDTSPLSALLSIQQAELLRTIFGQVVIPNAVSASTRLLLFDLRYPTLHRVLGH